MKIKETVYQSPTAEVTEICVVSIICGSGPDSADTGINNPWIFEEEEV